MNANQLLDSILQILHTVKEDKAKLQKILDFLEDEIYEEPDEIEIPEKYRKVVSEIAESIDAGLICFLNPETLEIEDIPKNMEYEPEEYEDETGESMDTIELKHHEWQNCYTFEPLESRESFRIMEMFANDLADSRLQSRLIYALGHRKPFSNFKFIVENSPSRANWFEFKKQWLENHVKELLLIKLEEIK
jgi:hypothetical protein